MEVRCTTCYGTKKSMGLGMVLGTCKPCNGTGMIQKELSTYEKLSLAKKVFEENGISEKAVKIIDLEPTVKEVYKPEFVPPSQKETIDNGKKKGRK